MDAGMAPAHGLVSFCVCLVQHTRTMQRAIAQVEPRDVVAELAHVARQREARVAAEVDPAGEARGVVSQVNLAALRVHADEL